MCPPDKSKATETLFTCKYGAYDGKLGVNNEVLRFLDSAAVESECRVSVALKDVSDVNLSESDGLCIKTAQGDEYIFSGFEVRDDVLKMISMQGGSENGSDDEGGRGHRSQSVLFLETARKGQSDADLKKTCVELKKKTDPLIKDVAIENIVIPLDIDSFFTKFWSSSAAHPISTYQRDTILDTNINTSQWSQSDDNFTLARTINYLHPNTSPMGPAMAQTTKEQRLQKFGSHGMILHTTTKVDDVPMTDCFVIEDQIVVESKDDHSVVVSAKVGIRFVQKTMWKKLIEKNSKKGIMKWLDGYGKYLTSV